MNKKSIRLYNVASFEKRSAYLILFTLSLKYVSFIIIILLSDYHL